MRDADDWPEVREKLRAVVDRSGVVAAARHIPCSRTTLFRLLRGDTVPALTTQDCIERFIDDQSLRSFVGIRTSRD